MIAGVVVVSLYQNYNRDQTVAQLRDQVTGLQNYYQAYMERGFTKKRQPVNLNWFVRVAHARIYYAGSRLQPNLPGEPPTGLRNNFWNDLKPTDRPEFSFTPPNQPHVIGVAAPINFHGTNVGAVILARPLADVNNAWKNVLGLVAAGTAIGLIVAF
ncbi:MAG: hypothetical protein ACTHNU_07525, partial [Gaiellales bacterium]